MSEDPKEDKEDPKILPGFRIEYDPLYEARGIEIGRWVATEKGRVLQSYGIGDEFLSKGYF